MVKLWEMSVFWSLNSGVCLMFKFHWFHDLNQAILKLKLCNYDVDISLLFNQIKS